jgi:hypothetical protein
MVAFRTPPDIGNRALQHCGAVRMDPTLGFSENSRNAGEVSFCYDMLREAELQRRIWTFATRRQVLRPIDNNTMLLAPALWMAVAIYFVGSIVSDQVGSLWISRVPNNLGNDPLLTTAWEPYFGPMAVPLYDATGTTAYQAGEIVYTAPGNGTALVYLSLQNGNSDVPATATAYDPTVTYFKNQVVTFSAVAYMSLIDLNLNNEPDLAPALFNIATTYAAGTKVGGSDGVIYQSIGSGNVGHDPTLDGGVHWTNTGVLNPWTTSFVGGSGSLKWLLIGGTAFPNGVGLTTLNIVYPQGTGPSTESISDNVYRLPAGYLRLAPQTPKSGLNSIGGPSGVSFNDWIIEGDYLISSDCTPITMRFVVNITDVTKMHTMFCEGLAARIGLEVCETVTQSTAKIGTIGKIYDRWISEAGMVDAIEDGYEDPPDDDLITVRL